MSDRPAIRGWCPGTLRPMESGDGLLVRVRPPQGKLTPDQAIALAALAQTFGNGMLQLTNRANIQIRGVVADRLAALQGGLVLAGLLDASLTAEDEARLNIIISPFYDPPAPPEVADTIGIAECLRKALLAAQDLTLPGKFGFAVDTGFRMGELAAVSADVRIECSLNALIVRADGLATGRPAESAEGAAELAVALARWFVAAGGVDAQGRGRMRDLIAAGAKVPEHLGGDLHPDAATTGPSGYPPSRKNRVLGAFGGLVSAKDLRALALQVVKRRVLAGWGQSELRVTPWRSFAVPDWPVTPEGGDDWPWITDARDPRLRVTACVGAPMCSQAQASTGWAQSLAQRLPDGVSAHLSGCAKGCAHPGPEALVLVGTARGFDLVRNGRAWDRPAATGLSPDAIPDLKNPA